MSVENLKNFLQANGVENPAKLADDAIFAIKPAAEAGMLYKEELLRSQKINSMQTPQLQKQESLSK